MLGDSRWTYNGRLCTTSTTPQTTLRTSHTTQTAPKMASAASETVPIVHSTTPSTVHTSVTTTDNPTPTSTSVSEECYCSTGTIYKLTTAATNTTQRTEQVDILLSLL